MKSMIKNSAIVLVSFAILMGSAVSAYASGGDYGSSNCQMIYGGGEVCNTAVSYQLNKQVQVPGTNGKFVENLTINDHQFTAGETVKYKVTATNTGDNTINNLSITDTLPSQLDYVSSQNGQFNSGNRSVMFTVKSLNADKSTSFIITAKVRADAVTSCPINHVTSIDGQGNAAQDDAMICINANYPTKAPVVQSTPPLKQTPSTGPEMLSLLGLIPSGALGIFLKKKSK